jgi:hypothetical protein
MGAAEDFVVMRLTLFFLNVAKMNHQSGTRCNHGLYAVRFR